MGTIEITNLTKRYGDRHAVDGLDLVIEDGQFITLLGPSGCGKTTTLRMLAGFIRPDSGTIVVDGRTLSSPSDVVPPDRRGMGMVFQNYALWPHKTVRQNVAYGLRTQRPRIERKEIQSRVRSILENIGLSGYEESSPGELSGGQQQRVAFARSLVTEPSILLLDEPLSNLDAKLRDKMREEMQEIQRRTGITFIYVTHDQAEAMSMSDRIAVMRSGRLEQFAPPRDVYFHPTSVAVADFMGIINLLKGQVEWFDETQSQAQIGLDCGISLRVVVPQGRSFFVGERITAAIRPESIGLRRPAESQASSRQATVTHITMLGNICYYTLAIGTTEIRVQTGNRLELTRGEIVQVDVEPLQASAFALETNNESLVTMESVR